MAMLVAPAHNAQLMVGHRQSNILLKDATAVVIELLGDMDAAGDGPPSVNF